MGVLEGLRKYKASLIFLELFKPVFERMNGLVKKFFSVRYHIPFHGCPSLVTLVLSTNQGVESGCMAVGLIMLVTEGITRQREAPWHRRGKGSRKNKKPVIQTVY